MEAKQLGQGLDPTAFKAEIGGVVSENQRFESSESTIFNWHYEPTVLELRKLYERGKSAQWNGALDLPWDTDVDLEQDLFDPDPAVAGEAWYQKLTKAEQRRLIVELNTQTLSQFLHGEQGALIATSQLVGAVPDADAKRDLYRRLARAQQLGEIAFLREELRDRFGPLPDDADRATNREQHDNRVSRGSGRSQRPDRASEQGRSQEHPQRRQ